MEGQSDIFFQLKYILKKNTNYYYLYFSFCKQSSGNSVEGRLNLKIKILVCIVLTPET